jgi:adenylate cyclase
MPSGEEIERKFLVRETLASIIADPENHHWGEVLLIEQRYILDSGDWALRVREEREGMLERHYLTLKRKITDMRCVELEEKISHDFYFEAIPHCGPALLKNRYRLRFDGVHWTIDEFLNPELRGILLAEVELEMEGDEFTIPGWCGEEVTNDPAYKNFNLVKRLG